MNCAEFHELAAAYAIDALPEDERLLALHHLTDEGPHEGCEELVARFERTANELAQLVVPVAPPPSLWRIIELRLGLVAGEGNVSPLTRLSPQPSRWREGLAYAAAAAALLGALWAHQTAQKTASHAERERSTLEKSLAKTSTELATTSGSLASTEAARKACADALGQLTQQGALSRDAVALLEQPTTKLTAFGPAGGQTYSATALYDATNKRAIVLSTSVPKVEGKFYELWIIEAGQAPKPAGMMRFDKSGVAIGEFDSALMHTLKPAALAVSLEPNSGRTAPTPTEVVLVAKLAG